MDLRSRRMPWYESQTCQHPLVQDLSWPLQVDISWLKAVGEEVGIVYLGFDAAAIYGLRFTGVSVS